MRFFIAALNTAVAMGYPADAVFLFHNSGMLGGVKKGETVYSNLCREEEKLIVRNFMILAEKVLIFQNRTYLILFSMSIFVD